MHEAGSKKLKRADLEDADRTQTQSNTFTKKRDETCEDVPTIDIPMELMDDAMVSEDPAIDEPVLEHVNEPGDMLAASHFMKR